MNKNELFHSRNLFKYLALFSVLALLSACGGGGGDGGDEGGGDPDPSLPNTSITHGPASLTNSTDANFEFSATTAGATFECSLDGGEFANCTSPKAYSGLTDGSHDFKVRATDVDGNTDPTPAVHSWEVDTTPPDASISTGPNNPTNSTSASFVFTSTEAGGTFQCSLDGGAYADCASPDDYSGLEEGSHTFSVQATDAAGNTDATRATYNWRIDLTPPDTSISSGPSNPTNSSSVSFVFASTETGSSFQCSLDSGAYTTCSSPQIYTGLAEGAHAFSVRATDIVGNVDPIPAVYNWEIDKTPPDTSISSGPIDPRNSTSATFVFASTETGSSFQCSIDGGTYANCVSPKTYNGLAEGSHTFNVKATDAAGNADATPAAYNWEIDTTPPDTTVDSGPVSPTNSPNASFAFSSTETGSSFQCSIDSGAYADCISPKAYASLLEGDHSVSVRATDAAGNTDGSPAVYTWTIDTTSPVVTVPVGITVIAADASGSPVTDPDIQTFLAGATATDNNDGDLTSGISNDAPSVFPMGTTTVTFSVSDAAGNTGSATSAVEVVASDNLPPDTSSIVINSNAEYAVVVDELTARLKAADNIGVTAYLITEHNATDSGNIQPPVLQPLPSDPDWVTVTPTTSFNLSVQYPLSGSYNAGDIVQLCAWFMDEQGNVSAESCDTITYTVTWENSWGNWYADNGVWEVGTPSSGPGSCFSGNQCAATVLDSTYPGTDSRLVSPSLQLPSISAGEEIQLRFWHWFAIQGSDVGRLQIAEETAPGQWSAWTTLADYVLSSSVWTRPRVDLSAYAGKKVRLAFLLDYGCCGATDGWYVDDVSVEVVTGLPKSLPFTDDYEAGLGDWWSSNGVWQVGIPSTGPGAAHSGSNVAGTVLDSTYPGTDSRLVSPSLQLPSISAGEEIQLRFWHWFAIQGSDVGRLQIAEETAPGQWSAWTTLADYVLSSSVWTRPRVDLSAYAGKKVRLAFLLDYGCCGATDGWYVDDINIQVY